MDRLTVKSKYFNEHYTLKCLCSNNNDEINCMGYCCDHRIEASDRQDIVPCEICHIQKAFDKLAAYENTELEPNEIVTTLRWQD